jgi:MoaA/NifB/PqqE/SkfB family radical SAM enzyme
VIVQVEISSACNARCVYCPAAVLRGEWVPQLMSEHLFSALVRELHGLQPEYVHLQGWGEPLLHPEFDSFAEMALEVSRAGVTTNATLVDKHLDAVSGLDLVAVTFAGARPGTHNFYRPGCDFDRVVSNVRLLARRRRGRMVAVYMLISDNYKELPEFVSLAAELGFDEVKASNVNYLPTAEVAAMRAFSDPFEPPRRDVERALEEAAGRAERLGLSFRSDFVVPSELAECPERPTNAIFVGVRGEVSPCVYLNLPTRSGTIRRVFNGREVTVEKVVLGKVGERPLREVLKRAREFARRFKYRRYNLDVGNPAEPPRACLTCYRLYGV